MATRDQRLTCVHLTPAALRCLTVRALMPDLLLYRRHTKRCPHKREGVQYTKCACPLYADGYVDGRRIRHSLKTRAWARAERLVRQMQDPDAPSDVGISDGLALYLEDCRARKLAASTVVSYDNTLGDLAEFCCLQEVLLFRQLTVKHLVQFRSSRRGRDGIEAMSSGSLRKESVTLRAFFSFVVALGWLKVNPARQLKPPKKHAPPALPFEREEITALLAACGRIENNHRESAARARLRARVLLLVFLYSGLRISDVAQLERSQLSAETGQLLLRMMKTGQPLYVRIPRSAVEALETLPIESTKYFFWSGKGKVSSIIGSIRRTVDCLMKLAGIKGRPHRFRDTFAVELLRNDTSIRTVQLLLGHSSVKTTEEHYAPWVRSHQKLLDDATATLAFGEPAPTE